MTKKEYYDFREEENTRQVSIYRLVRAAAARWKLILLAGIILGCLMGSYKILSIHSKKADMIEDYDNYKAKLEAYRTSVKDYRKTISDLQVTVAEKMAYIESSPKMKLDPAACPMSSVSFNIVSAGETKLKADQITAIKNAISDNIMYGDLLTEVAEKNGMSVKDIRELLTIKLSSSTGTSVRITVRGETEEAAQTMRDDIMAAIGKKRKTFASSLGAFNTEIFDQGTVTIMDTTIQTYQDKQQDALAKLQTSVYSAQNQSAALVKPVAVPQYSKKYMLINGIKMGIVGFAAGMILAAIAVMVLITQKGVILSADEINGEYGLRTLADFSDGKKKKPEEEMDYVNARIENCLGSGRDSKIGVVGSASEKKLEELAALLNKKAKENHSPVQYFAIPGITNSAKSLRQLSSADGVLLAEEVGKSDYYGIRKEIALIADSGRELLGTVYF